MNTVLSSSMNPVPAMFHMMRAGLRHQGLFAQRQLTALELLLRGTAPQVAVTPTGTLVDPLLLQQAQTAATLADRVIRLARLLSDMQARSAAQLLAWWEQRLGASVQDEEAAVEVVEPIVLHPAVAATPSATATSGHPAKRVMSARPAAKSKRVASVEPATARKRAGPTTTVTTSRTTKKKSTASRRTRARS